MRQPRGKGIQTMECGCRLMLVVCLTALACAWVSVFVAAMWPTVEIQ